MTKLGFNMSEKVSDNEDKKDTELHEDSTVQENKKKVDYGKKKPWKGKAQPADKAIIILVIVFMLYNFGVRAYTPFLLAENPILLSFLGSSTAAVGAAGAFANVNDTSLVLPIVIGVLGSIKLIWLFWWAGRRWGAGIIEFISPTPKIAERFVKLKEKKWIGILLLLVSEFPGIPQLLIFLLVGWQKMNLFVFLLISAIASSFWITMVAVVGYQSGQTGVDIVMTIDKYAIWITFVFIFVVAFWSARKAQKETEQDEKEIENIVEESKNEMK